MDTARLRSLEATRGGCGEGSRERAAGPKELPGSLARRPGRQNMVCHFPSRERNPRDRHDHRGHLKACRVEAALALVDTGVPILDSRLKSFRSLPITHPTDRRLAASNSRQGQRRMP
jgi:hypothetical protein